MFNNCRKKLMSSTSKIASHAPMIRCSLNSEFCAVNKLRDGQSRNRGYIPDRTDKPSLLLVHRPAMEFIPPRSRWALGASFLGDEEARL